MKEGWWVRLDNGESVRIHEHEIDIRRPDVAKKLGVSDELFQQFRRFEPVTDRIEFVTWADFDVAVKSGIHGGFIWKKQENHL